MKKKSFIVGIVFGAILFFFAIRGVDFSRVLSILSQANILPLLLGLLIVIVGLLLKTWRWQNLLATSHISFPTTFAALTIGYLVNNILPARLGEVARVYIIGRQHKVGISKTFGSIVVEKIIDTLILVTTLFFLFIKSPEFRHISSFFLGFVLPKKWQTRFESFVSSFSIFKDKKRLAAIIGVSILIWILEALWNFTIMKSLNIHNVSLTTAFILAAIVNLGLFIPSPPGYIGVFHFITTFTLMSFGIEKSTALSYAILQNALEYLLLTSLGVWSTIRLSFDPFNKKWQNI